MSRDKIRASDLVKVHNYIYIVIMCFSLEYNLDISYIGDRNNQNMQCLYTIYQLIQAMISVYGLV